MIGDLILFFKRIKKQTFCIHDYKPMHIDSSYWFECSKCERSRWYEP